MEDIKSSVDLRSACCQLLAKGWTLYTGESPMTRVTNGFTESV